MASSFGHDSRAATPPPAAGEAPPVLPPSMTEVCKSRCIFLASAFTSDDSSNVFLVQRTNESRL